MLSMPSKRVSGVMRLLAVAGLVASTAKDTRGQQAAPPPRADLIACADLDKFHSDMQVNLRASVSLVACGREAGGEAEELRLTPPPAGLVKSNVDIITGA